MKSKSIAPIKQYIVSVDSTILSDESKKDIISWLEFMADAPDSTSLMKWFWSFHTVIGFYISELEFRIDSKKLTLETIFATIRKVHQNERSGKITEGEARMYALLDTTYVKESRDIMDLERLHSFLVRTNDSLSSDLVESYGHNQRLEMRQD